MDKSTKDNAIPTELKTDRLILRSANMDLDADCEKVSYARESRSGGATYHISTGPEATRYLRYKNKVNGPRQELCTLATTPASIYWLIWLPSGEPEAEEEDLANLAGVIGMSFRQEMPYPDMGYVTVEKHAGHGYAAEAGKEVLRYWRDLVGVKEIFVGCALDNKPSQRCAERIGFVHGGALKYETGRPPNVEVEAAVAYVLPGMQWKDGWTVRPLQDGMQEQQE